MGVCWRVILFTKVGTLRISCLVCSWVVPGFPQLWSCLQPGIALRKTTETQASIKLIMTGSYTLYFLILFFCACMYRRCVQVSKTDCVCHMCEPYARARLRGIYLPTKFQCWEPHSDALSDHYMIFNTEPFLQLLSSHFAHNITGFATLW